MYIASKSRRGKDEKLHVFKFENENELHNLMAVLRDRGKQGLVDYENADVHLSFYMDILDKLESRADTRFSDDYHKLTVSLFEDEIDVFVSKLIAVVVGLGYVADYNIDMLDGYKKLVAEKDILIRHYEDILGIKQENKL